VTDGGAEGRGLGLVRRGPLSGEAWLAAGAATSDLGRLASLALRLDGTGAGVAPFDRMERGAADGRVGTVLAVAWLRATVGSTARAFTTAARVASEVRIVSVRFCTSAWRRASSGGGAAAGFGRDGR
jgi:hypothetical protein